MLSGDLFRGEHERRAAIGERAAIEELERISDVSRLEHLLDRDRLLELGLRVQGAVAVVLDGHRGHLRLGRAVLLHVRPRDQGEHAGEGEAQRLLPDGVGGVGKILGRFGRRDVQHPLGPAHQDDVRHAGSNLHDGVTEGGVRARARGLEAGRRHRRDAQDGRRLRAGVELVLGLAADHVAVVEGLHGARRTPESLSASRAASANSSAEVRSCSPNLVTPTPITATRRMPVLPDRMLALKFVRVARQRRQWNSVLRRVNFAC
jgi:hypothetical protein